MANSPLLIGLTGGIGSGKSAVSAQFSTYGVPIIDTDVIAHQLTQAQGAAIPALLQVFGEQAIGDDGAMNRAVMRQWVFERPALRQQLESILHPMILAESQRQIQQLVDGYAIVAVPLLFEHGHFLSLVNRVLVVDCPESLQIERVQARNALPLMQIMAIMQSQCSRGHRLAHGHDVIDNSGTFDELALQVAEKHRYYSSLCSSASQ